MRAKKPVMSNDNINPGGDVDNSECININSNTPTQRHTDIAIAAAGALAMMSH